MIGIIVVAAGFGLGVCYYQLFGLHELHAVVEYDDGVWFGSSVRLADGVLPYRSFVMDQPPGVPLLMAPFGLLAHVTGTRTAFGLARLVTPLVGTVTVAAAGWLVRHRGSLAVAVTCGVAAVYPETLIDERTVMLEPFCAALCVLGLVVAFEGDRLSVRPRRLVVAGLAFGLAGSCKAFAVLPFIVVTVALLVGPGRYRRVAALLAGAAGALAAVCGPFFVLAPGAFAHQVVATQILRSQKSEPAVWDRVFSLIGLLPGTGRATGYPDDSHLADVALVGAFVVLVFAGWAVRAHRRAGSAPGGAPGDASGSAGPGRPVLTAVVAPLDLVAFGAVVVTAVALVEPPAYYGHYAAFLAPFLAISLGLAAGTIGGRVPADGSGGGSSSTGGRALRPYVAVVVVAAALVAGGVHAVHTVRAQRQGPFQAGSLDALIPRGACVIGDNAPVLILADRFTSTVADCPAMVDAYGTTISAGHGDSPDSAAADSNGSVAAWRRLFARAGYVVLTSGYESERIPWTPQLRRYVDQHFRTLQPSSPVVLVRRSLRP